MALAFEQVPQIGKSVNTAEKPLVFQKAARSQCSSCEPRKPGKKCYSLLRDSRWLMGGWGGAGHCVPGHLSCRHIRTLLLESAHAGLLPLPLRPLRAQTSRVRTASLPQLLHPPLAEYCT